MVLDELATPLTRSWCLFEFLHAVELSESTRFDNFQGIFFCHSSGVLNSGTASVEISLALGDRLGHLRLEDASASRIEDKEMIDGLVIAKMGSFAQIDSKLCLEIQKAVTAAHHETDKKFCGIRNELISGSASSVLPPAPRKSIFDDSRENNERRSGKLSL